MIRLLITDVDGVWTDGRIHYLADGREMKSFHVRDGLAVKIAQGAGIRIAVVTSRHSEALDRRCRELGIDLVIQGARDKRVEVQQLIEKLGIAVDETCYVGDDLPDISPMQLCGLSAAPADAAPEVLRIARWKLSTRGGDGVLRELIERILREQGVWDSIMREYDGAAPQ